MPTEATGAVRPRIEYIYGIRGISVLYVMLVHLNYMIMAARHSSYGVDFYHRLTDWTRYGDFRVCAFFVVSGYLLMMPAARNLSWSLPHGVKGFLERRVERLLVPYYAALALSVVLFVLWAKVIGAHVAPATLFIGTLAHVLMIHNFDPRSNLYLNDALWNLALEFQCYVLFAFAFLPLLRRFGIWSQLALATLIGLGPHFLFHGFLDWSRPWFVIMYAMGVAIAAMENSLYPRLFALGRRIPWGTVWVVGSLVTLVLIARSPIDTPYKDGILQNLTLGISVSAFLMYTRTGVHGWMANLARPVMRTLENARLCAVGRFSYSIYLIHFPILRLATALVGKFTNSLVMEAVLGFFVFVPLTMVIAYFFHIGIERPFLERRKQARASAVASAPATVTA